jgi:hypothetical protein
MNINKFHNDLLAALGDNTGAANINEFRVKYVAAILALVNEVAANEYTDTDARNAIKTKTEIAALTNISDAADIVAALQA